jgi:molybdopterin-guanine dinucleotide biosynthesis protein A
MHGEPKGLLASPEGQPLVVRLIDLCRASLNDAEVVLVGQASAYTELALSALADDPPGIGPMGGLCALLAEAERRGSAQAFALACDLPYVTARLLARLRDAEPAADAVAPRRQGVWEPLFARYEPSRALAAAQRVRKRGRHALFAVLDELGPGARELVLQQDEFELLNDWDAPGDVRR